MTFFYMILLMMFLLTFFYIKKIWKVHRGSLQTYPGYTNLYETMILKNIILYSSFHICTSNHYRGRSARPALGLRHAVTVGW